jgi:hypothetical protein
MQATAEREIDRQTNKVAKTTADKKLWRDILDPDGAGLAILRFSTGNSRDRHKAWRLMNSIHIAELQA